MTGGDSVPAAGESLVVATHRWWAIGLYGIGLSIALGLLVLSVVPSSTVARSTSAGPHEQRPTPYARVPAQAMPVSERLTFGDLDELDAPDDVVIQRFASDGSVLFVTVSAPSQSVLSWLVGRSEPAVEFITSEQKFGVQTPAQRRVFSLEQMRTSEQVAQFVALERLGFEVDLFPGDVLIQQLVCLEVDETTAECLRESPSADVLEPGDQLLEIEGQVLTGVEDLTEVLSGRVPGDVVEVLIERAGVGELTVQVELTESPSDPGRTIVGFFPFDTRRVSLPFELEIDTGRIGGPSAGLAFSLVLIDELTPGSLTGGTPVAVTGTIELDGSVGAVGGLPQKAAAASRAGAQVFLVPAAQSEADIAAAQRAGGTDLEVIAVASLDEALAVLESLGGDPVRIDTVDTS